METKKEKEPIDILLFCPLCNVQHIDEAAPDVCESCGHEKSEHFTFGKNYCADGIGDGGEIKCQCKNFVAWLNPPHKSHRCANCNHVWRPSNYPTNGVLEKAIETRSTF